MSALSEEEAAAPDDGDPSQPNASIRYSIDEIVFSDGTSVKLASNAIVVLTGPNNSGKSRAINDITTLVQPISGSKQQSVGAIRELKQSFRFEDERKFVEDFLEYQFQEGHPFYGIPEDERYTLQSVAHWMDGTPVLRSNLFSLCQAQTRFSFTGDTERSQRRQAQTHPLHKMDSDRSTELNISKIIKSGFGVDLIADFDGRVARFRVGDRSTLGGRERDPSPEIDRLMAKLPTLEQQGDGQKGFVNIVLSTIVSPRPLVLIDEPEAFLHPPQSRKLARTLVDKTPGDTQLMVATHDYEFVKGLLDVASDRVTILRLRRVGDKNLVSELNNADLRTVLADNFIRTTDALAALFHDVTILCEGASDARALRHTMDVLKLNVEGLDLMFLSCGSKAQIDKVTASLRKLGVPVVGVTDCDILNNWGLVKRNAEIFGVNQSSIKGDHETLANAVNKSAERATPASIAGELKRIIGLIEESQEYRDGSQLPTKIVNEVIDIVEPDNQWKPLKKRGRAAVVEMGESPLAAFDNVVSTFSSAGLVINKFGELEGLWPEGPSGKNPWLEALLQRGDIESSSSFRNLREFCREVIAVAKQQAVAR